MGNVTCILCLCRSKISCRHIKLQVVSNRRSRPWLRRKEINLWFNSTECKTRTQRTFYTWKLIIWSWLVTIYEWEPSEDLCRLRSENRVDVRLHVRERYQRLTPYLVTWGDGHQLSGNVKETGGKVTGGSRRKGEETRGEIGVREREETSFTF